MLKNELIQGLDSLNVSLESFLEEFDYPKNLLVNHSNNKKISFKMEYQFLYFKEKTQKEQYKNKVDELEKNNKELFDIANQERRITLKRVTSIVGLSLEELVIIINKKDIEVFNKDKGISLESEIKYKELEIFTGYNTFVPIKDEWCLFWNSNSKHCILAKYSHSEMKKDFGKIHYPKHTKTIKGYQFIAKYNDTLPKEFFNIYYSMYGRNN